MGWKTGFLLTLLNVTVTIRAFQTVPRLPKSQQDAFSTGTYRPLPLYMSFFKDLMGKAFENDANLSRDKSEGQLEGPNDTDFEPINDSQKTNVQKKWLESQANLAKRTSGSEVGSSSLASATTFGAPLTKDVLSNTQWMLSLYLTGVPDFDPNSSLFGSRVNISTRRDSSLANDGFAIGTDVLPPEPSVQVQISIESDGTCIAQPSGFTKGDIAGEWKLSPDGRIVRFSLDVIGYKRTVKTTGSIQNIYWSDREEAESTSSATYSIPQGLVYGEANVGYGAKPGVLIMGEITGGGVSATEKKLGGVLRIERRQGLLGASTQVLPCGKFSAEMLFQSDE